MFREGALKCEHFLFVFHFGTKELYVSFSRTNFFPLIYFHWNLRIIFRKLNQILVKESLEKYFQLFSFNRTEVLWLIKWFLRRGCYFQQQNIIAIIKI